MSRSIVNYSFLFALIFSACAPVPQSLNVYIENVDVLHIENPGNKKIEKFDTIRNSNFYSTIFFESYLPEDLGVLDFIPMENNKRIEELIIRSDLREGLDVDLCKYENLKILDLSSCGLSSYFELTCTFPSVVRLDLSRNCLDTIPKIVYQFPNIEVINLKNNDIHEFSIEIARFPHLKNIDIRNTPIESKADSLRQLYPDIEFVTVL
jgi:Leucine-rich repeat (LRR) protein